MAGGVKAGRLEIEILADAARLTADMDRIKRTVKDASGDIARNAKVANDNIAAIGTGSRFTANQTRNLAFQFQDLGVQFAMAANSSKPLQGALMALAMQGPQIAMVLKEANQSLGGLAKEMGGAAAGFARAHPVMTALAVATAAAGTSFALFTREINAERKAELDAYSKSLGLSAEELKKLGPLTITAADAFNGLWKTIKDSLGLEKYFKLLGAAASQVFSGMLTAAKYAAAGIYAGFVGTVEGIKNSWAALPGILAEAATAAANAAISAIEKLINWQITGINKLIGGINSVLGPFMDKQIGSISPVQLGRITSGYEGAGRKAGQGFVAGYTNAFGQAFGAMGRFGERWADNTVDAAKKRYHDLADSKGFLDDADSRKAGGKAGKVAGEAFTDAMLASIAKGFEDAFGQSMENIAALLKAAENVDYAEAMRQMGENLDKLHKPLKDAAEANVQWNEELERTVAMLGTLGGLGGTLGGVLQGLSTGNWSGIGGKAGGLLQIVSGIGIGRNNEGIAQTLGDKLAEVFGKDGPFGATLKDVFTGAGIGGAIGGLAFGGDRNAQLGSTLGGAAGQALGSAFSSAFGKLASAAGPLGAIAGSLIGGMLGGLLKKAKTGSATIGVLNGELGIAGVRGNSSSRKAASTQGANSVIDALSTIADAFGASLGTAGVSVGMRNNSYRVDTTGQGRTKGAGVLNFGKDSEAALKAAIADAISDGVFVGLSAGVERLLKNGDVEKQLQKALSFQAVFDDLAAAQDPAKAAQDAITKWRDSMAKIFAEAGATAEELAKLEELTGIKRADAAKAAAEALFEKERPARELNIQIMELEGKTAEALAAARQLELDGMDESLRPLMQRIYALQDEAEAAAKANALAEQRKELETQLLEITDPVAGALARQVDALNALDPSLRAAQQAVWDAKDAADALAESQRLAKEIADERTGLETQWLQLIGDTNALRARERDGISETNRALYDQIIAEQDRRAAVEAATKAIEDAIRGVMAVVDQRRDKTIELARLLDPAAAQVLERADALRNLDPSLRDLQQTIWDVTDAIDAAAKAAQELKAITDQRRSLQIQLADLTDPAAAEAMRRADTLAALTDPLSRDLQQQIYDATDAANAAKAAEEELARLRELAAQQAEAQAAAEEARLQRIAAAHDLLISAYDRESGALQGTIDKFGGFAQAILAFRDSLGDSANPMGGLSRLRSQYRDTAAMAQFGNADALGRFTGDAQAYLDAARENAGTGAEYRRVLAEVLGGSNRAIGGAQGVASMAQQQLDAMKAQVGSLVGINEDTGTLVSVAEALAAYQAAIAEETPVLVDTVADGLGTVAAAVTAQTQQQASANTNSQTALEIMAVRLGRLEQLFTTASQDGALRIVPVETVNVNVTNSTLSVDQV